jgi:hypothetical protein
MMQLIFIFTMLAFLCIFIVSPLRIHIATQCLTSIIEFSESQSTNFSDMNANLPATVGAISHFDQLDNNIFSTIGRSTRITVQTKIL